MQNIISIIKSISLKSRIIVLLILGGVFLFGAIFILWQKYFFDTLIAYAPSDTAIYLRVSLPVMNYNTDFEELFDKILTQAGLSDWPVSSIKREAAFIGQVNGDKLNFYFLARVYQPNTVADFLNSKKLPYRFLASDLVAVGLNGQNINLLQDKKNQFLIKAKKHFSPFNSLSIYAANSVWHYFDDFSLKMFLASVLNQDDLFLNISAKRDKIIIFQQGNSKKIVSPQLADNYGIALVFNDFASWFGSWQNQGQTTADAEYSVWQKFIDSLKVKYSFDLTNDSIKKLLSGRLILLAQKNQNQSGFLMSDYDFLVSTELTEAPSEQDIVSLETVLKSFMAWLYPSETAIRLSDGARIVELKPNIKKFKFTDDNGIMVLEAPDDSFKLFYQIKGNAIVFGNKIDWLTVDLSQFKQNYFRVNASLIPKVGLGEYFSGFNLVEVGEGGAIFK